jgi:hypothetical protein
VMKKKLVCVRMIFAANYRIMRYNGLTFNRTRPSASLSIVFLVSLIRSGHH